MQDGNSKVEPSEIHYLRECAAERASGVICTTRRAKPWRLADPVFVAPGASSEPDNLCSYSLRGRRVMVTGPALPGSTVLTRSTDATAIFTDGHFPSVTAPNGATVTFAALWFGTDATPEECTTSWGWLQEAIRHEWRDRFATLHGTPATTGRDLFARSLGFDEWPVMSKEAQTIVRRTGGQGRMEMFRGSGRLTQLHEYDARMAYVGLMDNLPVGEPDALGAAQAASYQVANPYREGRYYVQWTAPRDWRHPGILPAHTDGDSAGPAWHWPAKGEGWCSGVELFTALQAGWNVQVRGGIVWPAQGSPLRTWRSRLLRILAQSEALPAREHQLVRRAVRAILLHTVGTFHGAARKVTRTGTADDIPDNAGGVRMLPDGRFTWWEWQWPAWAEMVHPEWSVTIWGRARARLLLGHRGSTGMLTVDPAQLVAARTDAVYTSQPTGWEAFDNGAPGRYRHQVFTGGDWPATSAELLTMRGA